MQTKYPDEGCIPISPPARNSSLEARSILFSCSAEPTEIVAEPPFFHDLNLDRVVDAVTAGREEYNLRPFFYSRLLSLAEIAYRQEIMRDFEQESLFKSVKSFSKQMRAVREQIAAAGRRYYKYERERWFLDAAATYCEAVLNLTRDFQQHVPNSRGLLGIQSYLASYVESEKFKTLLRHAKELMADLSSIRYCIRINGFTITVQNYDSEMDYSAAVEETFAKFKQGEVKDYLVKLTPFLGMNHVEAAVLERVAQLNPNTFSRLIEFPVKHEDFLENAIAVFDREIQFYLAYLEHIETFKHVGLKFCYPKLSNQSKDVSASASFDLALADKLVHENSRVVCNDFFLKDGERMLVVTGPNQGGKTTFARMFGQLHYMASLGCPVPGTEARLFLSDKIFTHFEQAENISTLRGKLQDDLFRIHDILIQATPSSIIIINEIFSSTSVRDGVELAGKVMERLSKLDLLAVCVTFLDELASFNEKTVSMVATITPDNPTLRTYRIERRPANGLAYALAIAEKHRVTYEHLKTRIKK